MISYSTNSEWFRHIFSPLPSLEAPFRRRARQGSCHHQPAQGRVWRSLEAHLQVLLRAQLSQPWKLHSQGSSMNFSALRGLCMFGVLRRVGAKTETEMQFTSTRGFTIYRPKCSSASQAPSNSSWCEPSWTGKMLSSQTGGCTEVSCGIAQCPKRRGPSHASSTCRSPHSKALDFTPPKTLLFSQMNSSNMCVSLVYRYVRNSSGSFSKQLAVISLMRNSQHLWTGKKVRQRFHVDSSAQDTHYSLSNNLGTILCTWANHINTQPCLSKQTSPNQA